MCMDIYIDIYVCICIYMYMYMYIYREREIPSILNSDMCIHTHTWRQRQRKLCLLQFTVSALVQCGGVIKPVEATEATDALSALVYCVCFSLLCLL
jgi:hypothetical protein